MKTLLFLAALLGVSLCMMDDEWTLWKAKYGKTYLDDAEESVRRIVWNYNWRFVQQHNSEHHSYTVAMNKFADLTSAEFAKIYLSKINMNNHTEGGSLFDKKADMALPSSVDWRTKGVVTGVKNQGQCGSCWAFSTTGSLEGQHAIKTGTLVSLSEQQLVDCSGSYGNEGCDGGLMDNAFKYIKANGGLDTEECYPYRAHDERCSYKSSCEAATDTGFVDVQHEDEDALQQAVATVGPISVAIDASHQSFQMYESGVYNEPDCSETELDHGVLAVGYGVDNSQDYWLVKNSWGTDWGMKGYIYMSRNKDNQCGIATEASYPTV